TCFGGPLDRAGPADPQALRTTAVSTSSVLPRTSGTGLGGRREGLQVAALVGELLVDHGPEPLDPRGLVLLASDDLVDVGLVDDQRAGVPPAAGQRLRRLCMLGEQLHRDVALQPVLRRRQRRHVSVLDGLQSRTFEIAAANQEVAAGLLLD